MMHGYPSVAVINSFERLSTSNTANSSSSSGAAASSIYHSYPNPKKARMIHHTLGNKNDSDLSKSSSLVDSNVNNHHTNNDTNNNNTNNNSSTKRPELSNDLNNSAYSSPCFYSSSLLEPYAVNTENILPNTTVTAAAVQSQLDLQRIAAVSNPNAPFSSIFLTGGNFDWDNQKQNGLDSMKQQFNNINCSVNSGYEALYGDITGVASNMLQGLKVRPDSFPAVPSLDYVNSTVNQQQQRYIESSYLPYEPRQWYKLKDELRSTCPVGSSISSDVISSGYDYSYRDIKEKRKCDVCGDISAGFHCSAFVCEACKKFFIRSSKGDSYTKYSCTKSNNCEIVKDTRTHCQYCRYQKCVRLGMTLPGANITQNADISLIPCRVCGANSSGFHFGAITCEGCKGFFRRTINERENQKYTCRNGGQCAINTATRNNCKSCRYKKCEAVGMSKGRSRIGRQPNAIKHMCAKEISQIRALTHFTGCNNNVTGNGSGNNGMDVIGQVNSSNSIGQYLPNHLSNVIISSMNLDFGLSGVSRCIQSSSNFTQPSSTTTDFYIRDSHNNNIASNLNNNSSSQSTTTCGLISNSSSMPLNALSATKLPTTHSLLPSQDTDQLPYSVSTTNIIHHHDHHGSNNNPPLSLHHDNTNHIAASILPDSSTNNNGTTNTNNDRNHGNKPSDQQPQPPPSHQLHHQHHQLHQNDPSSTLDSTSNPIYLQQDLHTKLLETYKKDISIPNQYYTEDQIIQQYTDQLVQQQQQQQDAHSRNIYHQLQISSSAATQSCDNIINETNMITINSNRFSPSLNYHNNPTTSSTLSSSSTSLTNNNNNNRTSHDTKFTVDMPLHKFITNVNNACFEMRSFLQVDMQNTRFKATLPQDILLDVSMDETIVWEAMMRHFHAHAIQVIKFAKAVPGFRDLCQNDMKVLVQEGMYPIILVQLSRDYNLETGEYNYFHFTPANQSVILQKFHVFNKIASHVKVSGQLIKPLDLDETVISLICYIELLKGGTRLGSDACSIINRTKVNEMYEYSMGALRLHMTETGSSPSKIEAVHSILQHLSTMTHEHQEAVITLRHSKPNLKFPNLYAEMFLLD